MSVNSRSTGVERVQFGSDPDRIRAHIGLLVCVIHCIAMNPKSAVDLCVCVRVRANLVK